MRCSTALNTTGVNLRRNTCSLLRTRRITFESIDRRVGEGIISLSIPQEDRTERSTSRRQLERMLYLSCLKVVATFTSTLAVSHAAGRFLETQLVRV